MLQNDRGYDRAKFPDISGSRFSAPAKAKTGTTTLGVFGVVLYEYCLSRSVDDKSLMKFHSLVVIQHIINDFSFGLNPFDPTVTWRSRAIKCEGTRGQRPVSLNAFSGPNLSKIAQIPTPEV